MTVFNEITFEYWSPLELFAGGEDGFIIDASELDTLFQTTTFTTPVTTDGDDVGSVRDLTDNDRDWVQPTTAGGYPADGDICVWNENGNHPTIGVGSTAGASITCLANQNSFMWAASGVTIAAAVKANPASNGPLISEGRSSSGGPIYEITRADATAADNTEFIRDNSFVTVVGNVSAGTNMWDNTDNTVIITDDGSTIVNYLDNSQVDSQGYDRTGHTLTLDQQCIGALLRTALSEPFVCDIYALLAIDRVITAAERALLTTWLGLRQNRVL